MPAPRPGTKTFQRTANRLPARYYEGGISFVTLNCHGKSPRLRKPDAAKWREEEDRADVALHIAANPVRRALVADWEEYSFTGGSLLARSESPAPGDLKVTATSGQRSRFLQ